MRYDVCMCVCHCAGLPDEEGRVAILQIHTKLMRTHGKLANDVDMVYWGHKAKNFSGAELEGLVRAAQATAMNKLAKVGAFSHVHLNVNILPYACASSDFRVPHVCMYMYRYMHEMNEYIAFGRCN